MRVFAGVILKRILCVDAQGAELKALKTAVESAGYEALTAASAQQALAVLNSQAVDGVLLDCRSPDMKALAVRQEMSRIKPSVPVLLVDGPVNTASMGLRCIDAYIQKPEPPDQLLRRVAGIERLAKTSS